MASRFINLCKRTYKNAHYLSDKRNHKEIKAKAIEKMWVDIQTKMHAKEQATLLNTKPMQSLIKLTLDKDKVKMHPLCLLNNTNAN